ncbi:MAG: RagB/SusD family nutrient uptake outer membrane protein [Bacteroidales bacterium]|jgi:tetratricopeptide (TPR) repeat protein|nr:RagB/SusD family nutrient uptake outer membrane protein [Bacteroidales bacterium]
MKTIQNILLFVVITIFATSCGDKWLDVYPSNGIATEVSITNIEDARAAINGVYYEIQRSSYYGGTMSWFADLRGDDMRPYEASSTRSPAWYEYRHTPANVPTSLWQQPYFVIRLANNILSLIDDIEITTTQTAERDYIKGEALMARALAHFDLCRVFGYPYMKDGGVSLGATIVRTPITASAKLPRNSVAQNYNELIIPDLLAAIPLLSENRTGSQGRFNKWAAKLLLSRVYLYKGDDENALRLAEDCIAGAEAAGFARYTHADYLDQWQTKFSAESLFEIANISGQNTGSDGIAGWCSANAITAPHEIGVTQSFFNLLRTDPDDARLRLLRTGVRPAFTGNRVFILKYTNGATPAESNVMVFRLSEAYLNAAEAAVKTGNNDKALQYLNAIVSRANPDKNVTGIVTLDRVLEERRKELFGEGHRAFDLLRNGKTIVRTTYLDNLQDFAKEIDWNNYRCVMPIPIAEIETNPNMTQNPGWGVN